MDMIGLSLGVHEQFYVVSFPRCSLFTISLVFPMSLVPSFWSPSHKLSISCTVSVAKWQEEIWERWKKRKAQCDPTSESCNSTEQRKISLLLTFGSLGSQTLLLPLLSPLPPLPQDNLVAGSCKIGENKKIKRWFPPHSLKFSRSLHCFSSQN